MKTFLPYPFTCLFFIFFNSAAQNLVPNPGFEIMRRLPEKKNNSITCTKNWMCPTNGAGDYYHRKAGRHAGVPRNVFGRQKPHSGDAYGGICVRKKFIEYLSTKLIDTLEPGREYLVELYISRAEKSIGSVKEFGVMFTKGSRMGMLTVGIPEVPGVDFKGKRRRKKGWTKLSAVYTAEGIETALIIGYFNYNRPQGFRGIAHYYIDDVSVTPLTSAVPPEKKEDSVIVDTRMDEEPPETFAPKVGEIITLQNIFFATNKSELLPASFPELDKLVRYLSSEEDAAIEISGHTDKTGNESQNKLLSEARAKAVADYLISNEIASSRIYYVGYGSSRPLAAEDSNEGKQKNRRVEFMIVKK